jgi:polar amino acid transport system substrate-binding protein
MKNILLLILSLISVTADVVNVQVNINKPFVFYEQGELVGFDIDLLRAVEKNEKLKFTITPSEKRTLGDLSSFTNEILVGGISITSEREKFVDFSFPYLTTGLKVMVLADKEQTLWSSLKDGRYLKVLFKTITQPAVLEVGIWYLLFIFVFAHIIWFADLGDDNGISDKYWTGIGQSIYFCFVTCSTVGFGDIVARRPFSRIVTILLIMCGIAFYANFTATLAAQYTSDKAESSITSIGECKKIGTIEATTSESYLKENHPQKITTFNSLESCIAALLSKKIDGILYDAPSLYYEARNDNRLIILPSLYAPQSYGFVIKDDLLIRRDISLGILRVIESGEYTKIWDKWFSK